MLPQRLWVCEEKSHLQRKIWNCCKKKKLRKFEKYNQSYFETLVLNRTAIMEISIKIRNSFKTITSKKTAAWQLKKSQSSDKLL